MLFVFPTLLTAHRRRIHLNCRVTGRGIGLGPDSCASHTLLSLCLVDPRAPFTDLTFWYVKLCVYSGFTKGSQ